MHKTLLLITIFLSACAVKQPVTSEQIQPGAEEYYQRALHTFSQGELIQAQQDAENSIRINPDHAHAHQLMGLINQQLGRNALATENFTQAIRQAPDDAGIANNYASLLCARNKYSEAEKNFLAAANLPQNEQPDIAWTNAGLCALRASRNARAKSFFEEAIKINPGQTIALYQLAKLELENGYTLIASDYLEQYLQHAAHTAKTLLLGAQIENAMGNDSSVEDYIDMLRTGFPGSAEKTTAEELISTSKTR